MHSRMNAVRSYAPQPPWPTNISSVANALTAKSTMAAIDQPASDMLSSGRNAGADAGSAASSQGAPTRQDGNTTSTRSALSSPVSEHDASAKGASDTPATYAIGAASIKSTIGAAGGQTATISIML